MNVNLVPKNRWYRNLLLLGPRGPVAPGDGTALEDSRLVQRLEAHAVGRELRNLHGPLGFAAEGCRRMLPH